MTLAEITRVLDSKKRLIKIEERNKAIFDYKLADLIGRSVARIHNSANHFPTLGEAYPQLFDEDKEKAQENRDKLSAIRFRQFAQSYNKNYKEVASKE